MDLAMSVCASTLSCTVTLSVKIFPTYPSSGAVCAEWEGDGDVDYDVFAKSVQSRDGTQERAYLRDIIQAVLSWNPCL